MQWFVFDPKTHLPGGIASMTQRFGAILKSSQPGFEIPLVNLSIHFTVPFNQAAKHQPGSR
jgi:hypothetical protein